MKVLIGHFLRLELRQLERLISPLIFALIFQVLFAFTIGTEDQLMLVKIHLTSFFCLQLILSRSLENESRDEVFDVIRSYPLSPFSFFLAKYLIVLLMNVLFLSSNLLITSIFHAKALSFGIAVILLLSSAGLSAIGLLLSAITIGVRTKNILYPILFFPLSVPIFIMAVEASKDGSRSWVTLLGVFDLVYFALAAMLFDEVIKES